MSFANSRIVTCYRYELLYSFLLHPTACVNYGNNINIPPDGDDAIRGYIYIIGVLCVILALTATVFALGILTAFALKICAVAAVF